MLWSRVTCGIIITVIHFSKTLMHASVFDTCVMWLCCADFCRSDPREFRWPREVRSLCSQLTCSLHGQGSQCIQPKPVVVPVPVKTTCLWIQDVNPDQLLTQCKPQPEPIPVAEPTKTNEPSKQDKPRRKHDFCRPVCSYKTVTLRTLWFSLLLSRYSCHWNIRYCQVIYNEHFLSCWVTMKYLHLKVPFVTSKPM